MAKGKQTDDEPPMSTIFKAIQQQRGGRGTPELQTHFVRQLLEPEYTKQLLEHQIVDKARALRKKIQQRTRDNSTYYPTGTVRGRNQNKKYDINDLFQLGPEAVFRPEYLQRMGYELSQASGERKGADEGDAESNNGSRPLKMATTAAGSGADEDARTKQAAVAPSVAQPGRPEYQERSSTPAVSTARTRTTPMLKLKNPAAAAARASSAGNSSSGIPNTGSPKRKASEQADPEEPGVQPDDPDLSSSDQHKDKRQKLDGTDAPSGSATQPFATNSGSPKRKASEQAALEEPGPDTDQTNDDQHRDKRQKLDGNDAHPRVVNGPSRTDGLSERDQKLRSFRKIPQNPDINPIKSPISRPHLVDQVGRGWVMSEMNKCQSAIQLAMLFYMKKYGIDAPASPQFVNEPSAELEELYRKLFSDEDWRVYLLENQDAGGLRQDRILSGLFGTAIQKYVFEADLPWDIAKAIPEGIRSYMGEIIDRYGYEFNTFFKHIGTMQIIDEKFLDETIGEFAKELAGKLILILQPHMRNFRKDPNPNTTPEDEEISLREWYREFETAVKHALIVKHGLQYSTFGDFEYGWPKAGSPYIPYDHQTVGIYTHVHIDRVLFPILPWIKRRMEDGELLIFQPSAMVPFALRQ